MYRYAQEMAHVIPQFPIFYHIMLDESVIMLRRIAIVLVALVHVDHNQLPKIHFQNITTAQQYSNTTFDGQVPREKKRNKSQLIIL